jgi:hypothetical protein
MSITQTTDRLEVVHADRQEDQDTSQGAPQPRGTVAIGTRPTFTITEAAAACAVSRKTITRKLVDLAAHGAAKDDDGIWRIPVEALLALGLHPGRSLAPAGTPTARPSSSAAPVSAARAPESTPVVGRLPEVPDMVSVPRDRWDDLRIRLARAEAEAAERALALADARLALRALTAGPAAVPAHGGPATTAPTSHEATDPRPVSQVTAAPMPVVSDAPAQVLPSGDPGDSAQLGAAQSWERPMDDLASARSQAARTGGYVPAAGTPQVRKRRWWQAK